MIKAMARVILWFALLSFMGWYANSLSIRRIIKKVGIRIKFYPAHYIMPSRKMRKIFKLDKKEIPKWTYLSLYLSFVYIILFLVFLILSYQGKVWLEQRESKGLWGGLYCFPQFDDKQTLLNYLKEQGITEYQEWVTFRHTFSHFHLDIHPIYVEVDRKSEEGDRSDWKKLSEKGKESQSGLLSAVKYWYDPTSPEQIGLAQPVKNLLTQFVRNYYG